MDIGGEVEDSVRELRQYFKTGKTRSVTWRKNQLNALLNLIHENEFAISRALHQDLGKHPVEAYRDEVNYIIELNQNLFNFISEFQLQTDLSISCKFVVITFR